MKSLNRGEAIGRITREIKLTGSGDGKQAFCFIGLAVADDYKDKAGAEVKKTNFISIKAYGKTAEICEKYLHTGDLAYFEYKVGTWESGEGDNKVYHQDLTATSVQFLQTKGAAATDHDSDGDRPKQADD